MQSALSKNPSLYILFSVLFNARAYYPVLAVLFLDLGLSLEQFVFLNLIWAVTICVFEVPSGALADTFGRRKLLLAAAILMIIEMACLLLAPQNGGTILLFVCVLNRVCSGLSEACASGADEALAYDSLPQENRAAAWDNVLARVMRWRSLGFVVAMIIGGLLYDSDLINSFLPMSWQLSENIVHRLPVALVFCQALVCCWLAFKMVEPEGRKINSTVKQAWRLTLTTGWWVLNHRLLLVAILIGVVLDAVVRNFATINSSYFRLIQLPEWSYGLVGAAIGIVGWFVPNLAKRMNDKFSFFTNLSCIALCIFIGLFAIAPAWPILGLLATLFLMSMMWFLGFTMSRVLHQEADSAKRATALSVKGLIFNLGYGLFSLGFSGLLAIFPNEPQGAALQQALIFQIPIFTLLILGLLVWGRIYLEKPTDK
jgi:MFS family permease